jgi:hypothetical protein
VKPVGRPIEGGAAKPVAIYDENGDPVTLGRGLPSSTGQKTAAGSTSVVPASDAVFSVKAEASTPGAATAANVTTSASLIKAASTRKRITITNDSANILYIGPTSGVTATNAGTKGLAIAANGGGLTVAWQTDIYGAYATGSNYVSYVEET